MLLKKNKPDNIRDVFAKKLAALRDDLVNFLRKWEHDRDLATECADDAIYQGLANWTQCREPEPRQWLFTIARNIWCKGIRRKLTRHAALRQQVTRTVELGAFDSTCDDCVRADASANGYPDDASGHSFCCARCYEKWIQRQLRESVGAGTTPKEPADTMVPSPDHRLIVQEDFDRIVPQVRAYGRDERALWIIQLKIEEDLTDEEIGHLIGCSRSAVWMLRDRAARDVREREARSSSAA